MTTLITNPAISTTVDLPPGFFAGSIGPREGLVVSDPAADVTAALAGLGLTVQTLDTGTGDVVGPGSSTDNAFVRWDGTTGLLVRDSNATLANDGAAVLNYTGSSGEGLRVNGDSLIGGKLAVFRSDSSSPFQRDLVEIINVNAAASLVTPLIVRNTAPGDDERAASFLGRVGVGAQGTDVESRIEVVGGTVANSRIRSMLYGDTTSGAELALGHARNTLASPDPPLNNDELGVVRFRGFDDTAFRNGVSIIARAAQTWATGAAGSDVAISIIQNGTTTPVERLKIDNDGTFTATTGSAAVDGFSIDSTAVTTASVVSITESSNTLTTGSLLKVTGSSAAVNGRSIVDLENTSSAANNAIVLDVSQAGGGPAVRINNSVDSPSLVIAHTALTTDFAVSINDTTNNLTTGSLLFMRSTSVSTSSRSLLQVENLSSLSTGATCLELVQASAGIPSVVLSGAGSGIRVAERAASPTSVAASGSYWARNDAAGTRALFADDTGADHLLDIGYTLCWGADLPVADIGHFATANGVFNSPNHLSAGFQASNTAPRAGTATVFAWSTEFADATTVMKLHVESTSGTTIATITLDGPNGSISIPTPPAVGVGDFLFVEYDAGSDPERGTYIVYIS